MAAIPECSFCSLLHFGLPKHAVYEDQTCFVMLDRQSLGWAHCMVIPKSHARQIFQLGEESYQALLILAKRLAPILQAATGATAVGFVAFGSGLPHAHIHLVPHSRSDILINPSAHMKDLTDTELLENAERLRPYLRGL